MSNIKHAISVTSNCATPIKGDHWTNDQGTGFRNPWNSFKYPSSWEIAKFARNVNSLTAKDPDFDNAEKLIPQVKADFTTPHPASSLKATWLGHACFLVELPSLVEGERGITILFDPAWSYRCSPIQWLQMLKPRYTPVPCKMDDLPEIDAVVISHNHCDHLDLNTLGQLYKRQKDRPPALFVPLNTSYSLTGTVPSNVTHELDWWGEREISVTGKGRAKIICTPAQHTCKRSPFDAEKALWASWAVQSLDKEGTPGASVWFGGDTGYSTVNDEIHHIDPSFPVCPAFAEIGERYGPFTLGLIPIGAYAPRFLMSPLHNAPIDSVRMFKDIKCKSAIGIHWGTWRLTTEVIDEPPKKLAEARDAVGLTEEQFRVVAIGETRAYEP